MAQVFSESDLMERIGAHGLALQPRLAAFLASGGDAPEDEASRRLRSAMEHGALAGGKRLRPALVLETAALFGEAGPAVWRGAVAVELVHCFSLVHDDLPAMDDDLVRRGVASVYGKFGEATALLAGTGLLLRGFAALLPGADEGEAARTVALRQLGLLLRAAGDGELLAGQAMDLDMEAGGNEARLESMRRRKTGALFGVSCALGAVGAGAGESAVAAVSDFGRNFGVLYQIADDLEDRAQDARAAGTGAGDLRAARAHFASASESVRRSLSAMPAARFHAALLEWGVARFEAGRI